MGAKSSSLAPTAPSAIVSGENGDIKSSMPDENYPKPVGHPLLLTGTKTSIERQFAQISRSFHVLKDGGYRKAPSGEFTRLLFIREASP